MYNTLAALRTANSGTGTLEVHLLSLDNNFSTLNRSSGTAITLADRPNFGFFSLYANNDLMAVKTRNTGSDMVEVHIMTDSSDYLGFDAQEPTAIDLVDGQNFIFRSSNWTRDLIGIKIFNTPGWVEVHVLSRSSGYREFTTQRRTAIPLTDVSNYRYFMTRDGLVFFKVRNTGNVLASLLTADSNYQSLAYRTDMDIGAADSINDTFTTCSFQGGGVFPPVANVAQIVRPRFEPGIGPYFDVRVASGHNMDGGRYANVSVPLRMALEVSSHSDWMFAGI